jgi:hypothetical protein
MAEHDGAAVVCCKCDGTGRVIAKLTYRKFKGRKKREEVKRVYDSSHGYFISAEDVTTEDGQKIEFTKAGCSYAEWLNGAEPKPMKDLICPYQHTNQGLQTDDINGLYATRCKGNLGIGSLIKNCPLHDEKEKCWEIFEEAECDSGK